MRTADQDRIARFRSLNRLYTQLIGVLDDGYLHTPWSVTEARVIFELPREKAPPTSSRYGAISTTPATSAAW